MLQFFDAATNCAAIVDYAGLIPGFGTMVTGSVSERPFTDKGSVLGRIIVNLYAEKALTWVADDTVESGDVLFGNRL
jgi:hypothetical protein